MPYRIVRPGASERQFFHGFALKPGESLYIDNEEVAHHFMLRANWLIDEVDSVPKDYSPPSSLLVDGKQPEWMVDGLIHVMKCPSLRALLRENIVKTEEDPKGSWEICAKPSDWSNPFFYGYDTRKLPFKIKDFKVVQKFAARGFSVRDAKTKRPMTIEQEPNLMGGIEPKPGKVLTTADYDVGSI